MNICEKDTLANETWVFVDILKQKCNFARARTRAQIFRSETQYEMIIDIPVVKSFIPKLMFVLLFIQNSLYKQNIFCKIGGKCFLQDKSYFSQFGAHNSAHTNLMIRKMICVIDVEQVFIFHHDHLTKIEGNISVLESSNQS